ncbi:MAG: ribosomal export protein [Candidatus Methanomethylophilaceae archaeon]|nr:ribosomal export protein [Candidatus Methanomethylophilaceae archaeon]
MCYDDRWRPPRSDGKAVSMFCVRCGKEGETYKGRCIDCFLEGRELLVLSPHVDLERCTGCEEYRIGRQWLDGGAEEMAAEAAISHLQAIADAEVKALGSSVERQDDRNMLVKIEAEMLIDDHEVRAEAETVVRIKNTVCQRCSRRSGNYYEAVLQLRASGKALDGDLKETMLQRVMEKVDAAAVGDRQVFISKVEEMHGGLDIYLSSMSLSKSIAHELVNEFGAEMKESSSLVGRKGGENVYRATHLVRLPPYKLNDILDYEGTPHQLVGINRNSAKLLSLRNFQFINVRLPELQKMKVFGSEKEIAETVVIARYEREIQVLHPINYSTVSLRTPPGYRSGDTARVFLLDDELFLVP